MKGKTTAYTVFLWLVNWLSLTTCIGFPGGSEVKNPPANAGDVGSIPLLGRFPWRRKWQPTPVFLPGKSQGQRSLVGWSPQGRLRVRHDLVTKPQQSYVYYLFLKKILQAKWVGAKLCRITLISSQKSPHKQLSCLKAGANLVSRKTLQLLGTSEQNPEDTNYTPALVLSNVSICPKERISCPLKGCNLTAHAPQPLDSEDPLPLCALGHI